MDLTLEPDTTSPEPPQTADCPIDDLFDLRTSRDLPAAVELDASEAAAQGAAAAAAPDAANAPEASGALVVLGRERVDIDNGHDGQADDEVWQYYPTPASLATKFWEMFKLDDFDGPVLDAFAGQGDLTVVARSELDAMLQRHIDSEPGNVRYWYERHRLAVRWVDAIEAIEIDVRHHPVLTERGLRVVGLDIDDHPSLAQYRCVVANPPFARGAHHALTLWSRMLNGTLGLILNAQTILNPCTPERRQLCELIARHGQCRIVEDAFAGPDAQRKARVDVALVRLDRPEYSTDDWLDAAVASLIPARAPNAQSLQAPGELMLPKDFVTRQVESYNLAIASAVEALRMQALAERCEERMDGGRLTGRKDRRDRESSERLLSDKLVQVHQRLLKKAWDGVLSSTAVEATISNAQMRNIESRFAQISRMAFSATNIHAFLVGLAEARSGIQKSMVLDVFDQLTRYTSENVVWHYGWRSNDVHAYAGRRLRTNRLVLPHLGALVRMERFYSNDATELSDIDRAFAFLDGTGSTRDGIVDTFTWQFDDLRSGKRCRSKYFDVRYYKGRGTVHLFPHDQKLLDRMNRFVGHLRRWLPPEHAPGCENFWKAYAQAERFTERVRESLKARGYLGEDVEDRALARRPGDTPSEAEAEIASMLRVQVVEAGLLQAIEHEQRQAIEQDGSVPGAGGAASLPGASARRLEGPRQGRQAEG